MTESDVPFSSDRSSPSAFLEDSLVLKNPLLVASPLGINRQFLVPLGTRSLTILNPNIFQQHSAQSESSLFQDSPFFNDRSPSESGSKQPIQTSLSAAENEQTATEIIQRSPTLPELSPANAQNEALHTGSSDSVPTASLFANNQPTEPIRSTLTLPEQQVQASAPPLLGPVPALELRPLALPELESFDAERPSLQGIPTTQESELQSSSNQLQRSLETLPSAATVIRRYSDSVQQPSISEQTAEQIEVSTYPTAQVNIPEISSSGLAQTSETDSLKTQLLSNQISQPLTDAISPLANRSALISNQSAHKMEPIPTVEKGESYVLGAQRSIISDEQSKLEQPNIQLDDIEASSSTVTIEPIITQSRQSSLVDISKEKSEVPIKASQLATEVVDSTVGKPTLQLASFTSAQVSEPSGSNTHAIDSSSISQSLPDKAIQPLIKDQPESLTRSVLSVTNAIQPKTNLSQIEPSSQKVPLTTNAQPEAPNFSTDQSLQHQDTSKLKATQQNPQSNQESPQSNALEATQASTQTTAISTISRSISIPTDANLTPTSNAQSGTLQPQDLESTHSLVAEHSNNSNTDVNSKQYDTTETTSLSLQNSSRSLAIDHTSEQLALESPTIQASAENIPFESTTTNSASNQLSFHEHNHESKIPGSDPSMQLKPQQTVLEELPTIATTPITSQPVQQETPAKTIVTQAAQWLSRAVTLLSGAETTANEEQSGAETTAYEGKALDRSATRIQQANSESKMAQSDHLFKQPSAQNNSETILSQSSELNASQSTGESTALQLKSNLSFVPHNDAEPANVSQLFSTVENADSMPIVEVQAISERTTQTLSSSISPPTATLPDKLDTPQQSGESIDLQQKSNLLLISNHDAERVNDLQRFSLLAEDVGTTPIAEIQPTLEDAAQHLSGSIEIPKTEIVKPIANRETTIPLVENRLPRGELQRTSESFCEAISETNSSVEHSTYSANAVDRQLAAPASNAVETVTAIDSTASETSLQRNSEIDSQPESIDLTASTPSVIAATSDSQVLATTALNTLETPSNLALEPTVASNSNSTDLETTLHTETTLSSEIAATIPTDINHTVAETASPATLETSSDINAVTNLDTSGTVDCTFSTPEIGLQPEMGLQRTSKLLQISEETVSDQDDRLLELPVLQSNPEIAAQSTLEDIQPDSSSLALHSGVVSNTIARSTEKLVKEATLADMTSDSVSLNTPQSTSESISEAAIAPIANTEILTAIEPSDVAGTFQPKSNSSEIVASTASKVFQPKSNDSEIVASLEHRSLDLNSTSKTLQAAPNLALVPIQLNANTALASLSVQPALDASAEATSREVIDQSAVTQAESVTAESQLSISEKPTVSESLTVTSGAVPTEGLTCDLSLDEQIVQPFLSDAIQDSSASSSLLNQTAQSKFEIAQSTPPEVDHLHLSSSTDKSIQPTLATSQELIQTSKITSEGLQAEASRHLPSLAESIAQSSLSVTNQDSEIDESFMASPAQSISDLKSTNASSIAKAEVTQPGVFKSPELKQVLSEPEVARSPSATERIQAKSASAVASSTQLLRTELPTTDVPSLSELSSVAPSAAVQRIDSVQADATLQLQLIQATTDQLEAVSGASWQQTVQESPENSLEAETTHQAIAAETIAQQAKPPLIQPAVAATLELTETETPFITVAQAKGLSLQADATFSSNPSTHQEERQVQPPAPIEEEVRAGTANSMDCPQAELPLATRSLPGLSIMPDQVQLLRASPASEASTASQVEISESIAQVASNEGSTSQLELPALQAMTETPSGFLTQDIALEGTESQQFAEGIAPVTAATTASVERLPTDDESVDQAIALSVEGIAPTTATPAIVQRLPIDNEPVEQSFTPSTEKIEPTAIETSAIVQRLPTDGESVDRAIVSSNVTSVDALQQPEITPVLPLVLQTLATLQPLSDRSQSNQLHHAPAAQVPMVRSATAETLHRTPTQARDATAPVDQSANQQKVTVSRTASQWSDFANLVQGKIIPSPRSSRSTAHHPSNTSSIGIDTPLQAKLDTQSEVIRLSAKAQPSISETGEPELDTANYLETLAQEIYQRLRQRMRVEQERQGRDYAGRLPW